MKDLHKEAQLYFASRTEDFWHWADRYQIIEWRNGMSICYRQDLLAVLQALQPYGLPPLEVILLILAACRESWEMTDFSYSSEYRNFAPILDFLKKIHALPPELREGHQRQFLLNRLFSRYDPWLNAEDADFVVKEFASGRIPDEKFIAPRERESQWSVISSVILPLTEIQNLEAYIRTGLDNPLQAAPVPKTEDLLAQLAQNPATQGLARLTKRLIAALHIPTHTQGASDQPIGGVSDLSNRGDLDRLLLSELANDDETLLARLANNEAMYLRRETLPDPQVQQHIVLVDVSLRQWGIPRFFGAAAALSFALNPKQGINTTSYALGDSIRKGNTLSTEKEVVQFLEYISPSLDCSGGLKAFFNEHPYRQEQEAIFFISSAEALADQGFNQLLMEYANRLDYLLVHERNGELWFYKLLNGRRRLLSNPKFDLPDLLFGAKPLAPNVHENLVLPEVFSLPKFPLLFPSFGGKIDRRYSCYNGQAVLMLTPNQDIWLWTSIQKGAQELLQGVPLDAQYWFWSNNKNYLFGLVQYGVQALLFIYRPFKKQAIKIDLRKGEIQLPGGTLKENTTPVKYKIHQVGEFRGDPNILFTGKSSSLADLHFYQIVLEPRIGIKYMHFEAGIQRKVLTHDLSPQFKKIINPSYSVLRNSRRIGINAAGRLQLDQWEIWIVQEKIQLQQILTPLEHEHQIKFETLTLLEYNFRLKRAIWPNGAEAFLDSRGFLHLRRAQTQQPEICLSLVTDIALGAYASDGVYCGNDYFTPNDFQQVLTPILFYERYVQAFIDHLNIKA